MAPMVTMMKIATKTGKKTASKVASLKGKSRGTTGGNPLYHMDLRLTYPRVT